MAKLNLTRAFDAGQVIQTLSKAGVSGMEDFLTYMQEFCNQVIGGLRKTLTIEDNMDSDTMVISLTHNVSQQIILPNPKKVPRHVITTKSIPFANRVDSFGWQITTSGSLEVLAIFTGSPSSTVTTTIVIYF